MAVEANNASPYTASVTVNSQSEGERLQGFRAALSQVVNQVSGDRTMASQLKINTRNDLYPFIKRYYYQPLEESEDADDDGEDADDTQIPSSKQTLVVEFDQIAVDGLIKTPAVATTSNLTHVLFWLAVDEGKKPRIVENDDKLAEQVKFSGKSKGLDLMLPMLDLDDIGSVNVSDVAQFNVPAISQASMRYGNDLVLVASVALDNRTWSAKWLLLKNGKRFGWSDEGTTLNGTILSGLLKASDMISNPSAVEINNEQHVILTLTGIGNVTHYAAANAYLQGLHEVSSVQILRVEPERVMFDVTLTNNDKDAFMKALQANPHFVLEANPSPQELTYTWKAN